MIAPPQKTKFTRYPKILLYGLPGLGKSTFAAGCPRPVFIATSDGLEGLSVDAFPVAKIAQDVRDAIEYLRTEKHDWKTVVLDTVGWLEKLIHEEVCAQLGLDFMTQASMKSYPLAGKKLKEILESLDRLNVERKMMVLIIGHATIAKFEDPSTASYDRYQLQMNEKVAELFMQDADIVAFMNQKVTIKEEKEGFASVKKASGSQRFLFFDLRPAFYAKEHGYGLPAEMPVEPGKGWAAMWEIMRSRFGTAQPVPPAPEMEQAEATPGKTAKRGALAAQAEAQEKRREAKRAKEAAAQAASDADNVPDNFINAK